MRPKGRALSAALTLVVGVAMIPFASSPAVASEEVYTVPSSGQWSVEGRGWGHGIGMSQWGAQGAALQGLSAEQILDFYYPGTVRFDIGQDYPLRVRLLSLAGSSMTAGPVPGSSLVVTNVATGATTTAPVNARIRVTKGSAGFTVTAGATGTEAPMSIGGQTVMVGPVEVAGGSGSQVWAYASDDSGTRYIGRLRALATGTSTLEVVNHVPMEQYLRGVVPRESPGSWAHAALQAQAIAARTYALAVRDTAGNADLCDTTACQVYGGAARSTAAGAVTELHNANTDAAIVATARIARYYGGGPAFTQFSSSNGGYSRVGSRPYLVAKADPYTGTAPGDSVTRWTGTLTVARVQQSCPSGGTLQRMILTRDGRGELGGRITSARLECTTGTATVNTPAFGLLSSWWRPSSVGAPFGNLEIAEGSTGGVTVVGWVIDPDTTGPVTLRITFGGTTRTLVADVNRPDIGAAFSAFGPRHGFDITYSSAPGPVQLCVVAVSVGSGDDTHFGCRDIVVPAGSPYGSFDFAVGLPGTSTVGTGISVSGWAVDPDVLASPIQVQARLDGSVVATFTADSSRPDVGAAIPGVGDYHGFAALVPASPGQHEVCLLAVNQPAGRNPTLGCRSVTVPGGSPVGMLEAVTGVIGGVEVAGWAIDPDTAAASYVWVDVSGSGTPVLASGTRPDVGAAYPLYGGGHGFRTVLPASPGTRQVCVTAVNSGVGSNTSLGCRTVTVPDSSPVGRIDSLVGLAGGVQLSGWALDPKTAASIYVWVDVSGHGRPVLANATRADIGAAFPGLGSAHGFGTVIPSAPGSRRVCVTAVNAGVGPNTSLGCGTVTVPDASPLGRVDYLTAVPGGVRINGWALDPETPASIYVWVDVSGQGRPVLANATRNDIGAAFPGLGSAHGFSATIPAAPGLRRICVTAVNTGAGSDTPLSCVSVQVPAG